jgi:type I restriction enzyme S subunit
LIYPAIRSDAVKQQADNKNAGSTVPHVNVADAKRFIASLPPLDLQNRFADFVRQADKSKFEIQEGLAQLQYQHGALMQRYFG